jgi:uncharacterized protein (TIGR03066 family)
MYLRAFSLALMSLASAVCLGEAPAQPPRGAEKTIHFELVYSGERLAKFRDRFKDKKFESKELTEVVFSDGDLKGETLFLDVGLAPKGAAAANNRIISIKVHATTQKTAPKAELVKSLTPEDSDFKAIASAIANDLDKAIPRAVMLNKLVGKWELKEPKPEDKVIIEFAKDGVVTATQRSSEGDKKKVGTYALDGEKLSVSLKESPEKEENFVFTVTKLTDTEFRFKEFADKVAEFTYVRIDK